MKKFLIRFENSKKVLFKFGMIAAAAGILFSCVHLRAIYYPSEVKANSTFDVTMVADMNNPLNATTSNDSGYCFVGALLPVGWTIDPTSFSYENKITNAVSQFGTLAFDQDMTNYCIQLDKEQWGENYYWQGFKTLHKISAANMDSVTVHYKVKTNNVTGDYQMLVGIQQTDYSKGPTLYENDPKGPFYQIDDKDTETKKYLSIKVVASSASGLKNVDSEKENYNVSAVGHGKIMVSIVNEQKVGATTIVYDANGKQVATQQLSSMKNILDVTLKSGVYFVAFQKDGIWSSKKVIVL